MKQRSGSFNAQVLPEPGLALSSNGLSTEAGLKFVLARCYSQEAGFNAVWLSTSLLRDGVKIAKPGAVATTFTGGIGEDSF